MTELDRLNRELVKAKLNVRYRLNMAELEGDEINKTLLWEPVNRFERAEKRIAAYFLTK